MRALLILASLLLTGCVTGGAGDQTARQAATPPPATTAGQLSPWLSPRAQLARQLRLTAPDSMDLRQALYFRAEADSSPAVLVRLRDYSVTGSSKPDPQHLVLLNLDAGSSADQEVADDLAIAELLVSPGRTAWVAAAFNLADSTAPLDAPVSLLGYPAETARDEFAPDLRLLPLGFIDERTLVARAVQAVQVDNGLPAPALDWQAPAQRYDISSRQLTEDAAGLFVPSPAGDLLAGYAINYTPALPADSLVSYFIGDGESSPRQLARFSYHVSYTPFPWRPPLIWLDRDLLATIEFLPDSAGVSPRPNHQGLFRLVTIAADSGTVTLVEDRLPAGMPVAVAGGVLFYTRQQYEQEELRWELWAASRDGLLKQRIWQPDAETVYLSVEDAWHDRLLVHRQYFDLSGEQPALLSELQEFSLEPLAGGKVKLDLAPAALPAPEQPSSDEQQSATGSGVLPLSIPD